MAPVKYLGPLQPTSGRIDLRGFSRFAFILLPLVFAGCETTGSSKSAPAQSVSSTAARSYAVTETKGAASLAALPSPGNIPPLAVSFREHWGKSKDLAGRPRVAVPNYGLGFIVAGEAKASSSGFGSSMVQRGAKLETALTGIDAALMKQMANEAHTDLLARLAHAGIDVVPTEVLNAHPAIQSLANTPGNRDQGKGIIDGRATKTWVVYGADAAPLGRGMTIGGYAREADKAQRASLDLDAVILQPLLALDYIAIESSGRKTFGGKASVDAGLAFSIHGASSVMFGYKINQKGAGAGGMLFANPTGTDAPFAVLKQTKDKSDSAAVSTAMALMGMGSFFRSSKAIAAEADPERWSALVRAAYQGYNQALVDQIVTARKGGKRA
jgi:hypothetical protein